MNWISCKECVCGESKERRKLDYSIQQTLLLRVKSDLWKYQILYRHFKKHIEDMKIDIPDLSQEEYNNEFQVLRKRYELD